MDKLLWMDLEMTGLDINKEVIIEVGAIVTDMHLIEIDSYHAVVKQPQKYIDAMDNWNQQHHTQSGLVALIPTGKSPDVVENELLDLVNKHWPNERVILAGNTIGQDRLFINKYFTRLAEKLHYRMLDVTAWKLIFNNMFKITYDKEVSHRAVDDIKESIGELKHYLQYIRTK